MRARLRLPADPRVFQIAILAVLLAYGLARLSFDLGAAQIAVTLASALLVQLAATRICGLEGFDPRSALISALSLCLLLRTSWLPLAAVAAAVAVGSKFLLRARGKHIFNPTNLALVLLLLATDAAWVSPSQWGSKVFFAFLLACLGGLVVYRSTRADVTLAFLAAYLGLLFSRALWLGDPWSLPLHQAKSGALLIFAFFMISDPKTTPDSRLGRVLFAAAVALGAAFVQFVLYRPNGALYALAFASPLVPLLDRWLPAGRYRWPTGRAKANETPTRHPEHSEGSGWRNLPMKTRIALTALFFLAAPAAQAFCGFYVARADTKLFNQASQVALVRDGDRTVMTMANDFKGELSDFAIVIPVPVVLQREQIHVGEKALLDHLDAYSAPRLVEYFDPSPCARRKYDLMMRQAPTSGAAGGVVGGAERARSLGVTIEASYTVGEYDILILSAKQSGGLVTWLTESGYRLPPGAEGVVESYLRQGNKFFVAKVNLEESSKLGFSYLRPIQVAYESPKFMLPIRLGTVNADGPQELYIYALTRNGRVETTNYRTVRIASDAEIPVFVKDDFGRFYRDLFRSQVAREGGRAVFLEYAWDMGWCDPCAADPLSDRELRELGVFWLDAPAVPERVFQGAARNVFITRLHVRYDREHFPDDLVFQTTGDRGNFQGRYILRHPWKGGESCREAREYFEVELPRRFEKEAATLAHLTGWEIAEIRRKMKLEARPANDPPWWQKLWDER